MTARDARLTEGGHARPTAVSHARPKTARNLEDSFRNIYAGYVNGIRIPTEEVQQARLRDTKDFKGITGAKYVTNEKEWIEVTGKAKKVVPGRRNQFGKTKRFGKIDRNN